VFTDEAANRLWLTEITEYATVDGPTPPRYRRRRVAASSCVRVSSVAPSKGDQMALVGLPTGEASDDWGVVRNDGGFAVAGGRADGGDVVDEGVDAGQAQL
jgi:hypothetical protein